MFLRVNSSVASLPHSSVMSGATHWGLGLSATWKVHGPLGNPAYSCGMSVEPTKLSVDETRTKASHIQLHHLEAKALIKSDRFLVAPPELAKKESCNPLPANR